MPRRVSLRVGTELSFFAKPVNPTKPGEARPGSTAAIFLHRMEAKWQFCEALRDARLDAHRLVYDLDLATALHDL